ncbi:type IV secretory system conjugative DNA transfer family protein [Pelosinus propionicus]|uniref:Type IV secretory system Conjugative DNA transfer n=1 Tax=Pelosinus propionicus DSM 13327 TaxID=1123291 RepID=A0A1I4PSH5_9FIRM|nr:type IV secretion system DNA-binding domain-containing protein [Pelosinus propionicus]SFM30821.1 Type IV secretory system Conjugative DNA transfer [Pelosinus propionicus DSM 13327]
MGLLSKLKSSIVNAFSNTTEKENNFSYLQHSLSLGCTTGTLLERGHDAPHGGQFVTIPFRNCCQNFISFGSTGEGKTSAFVLPIFSELLEADNRSMGGLIFDIKGDLIYDLQKIADIQNKEIKVIGLKEGQLKCNLLADLNPSQATDFLQSVYLLDGNKNNIDYWLKAALNLTEEGLRILIYTSDYTLKGLYQLIFVEDKRKEFIKEAKENHSSLIEKDTDFENAIYYFENTFAKLPENLRGSIEGSVLPILKPFQDAVFQKVFCDTNDENNYDMKKILNQGDTVIIDMCLAEYPKGRAVYTLIKLRYYNLIQSRFDTSKGLNKDRYCFFICDEFQDLIAIGASGAGLNDGTFWSKSRGQKMIGVVTSQSYNAILNSLGGNEHQAKTVLANFVNKVVFKLSDDTTIKYIQSLIGKVDVEKISHNSSTSTKGWGWNNTSQNSGYSVSTHEKFVIDEELIHSLGEIKDADRPLRTALALLSIEGRSCDDVVVLQPIYFKK